MDINLEIDFNLCSRVSRSIAEKYGGDCQAVAFPESERTVVVIWTAAGIIENGGFSYLFSSELPGDPKCTHAITALMQIGCLKAAEIVQKAVCLFPDCLPQRYDVERLRWYKSQPEELRDSLDTDFWNELDKITIYLAQYIRERGLDTTY